MCFVYELIIEGTSDILLRDLQNAKRTKKLYTYRLPQRDYFNQNVYLLVEEKALNFYED